MKILLDLSLNLPNLTKGDQVTRHVLGHAGVILAGRGMDNNFDMRSLLKQGKVPVDWGRLSDRLPQRLLNCQIDGNALYREEANPKQK